MLNMPCASGKKVSSGPTIEVLLNWFSKHAGRNKFKYDVTDSQWIDLDSIISTITLNFNVVLNVYTLNENDT
jgi:hypothetical protein